MEKAKKSPNTFRKMPFWAIKTQNFEKKYKINFKIWTILHMIFKAYKHKSLFAGARVLLKKWSAFKLSLGSRKKIYWYICRFYFTTVHWLMKTN